MVQKLTNLQVQHLERVYSDELKLCSCVDPDAFKMIYEIMELLSPGTESPDRGQNAQRIEDLAGNTASSHIALTLMEEADIVEHGGNIGGSWLTDKGKMLLNMLRRVDDWDYLKDRMFFDTDMDIADYAGPLPKDHECTADCWEI
ncbi:hypothetical protein [Rhodococcus qingshengii]|uniref:hypothetical protein n=1 Tax=Rhodococcus qingshengii TaxID=334542 RepID=UPI0035DA4084